MTIQEYLSSLRGKTAAVLGIGVSNTPLIELLCRNGVQVIACDKKSREDLGERAKQLEALGAHLQLGEGYLDDLRADVVFRTPGMRPDVPALLEAKARGSIVTSEMEIFFEVCPCTIIGVTGSDGKTTTTSIIAEMLRAAGKTVYLGGNIGHPLLCDAEKMQPEDFAVVELSSFQLLDMKRSPHIAVMTNLAPNHLDVHKDMDEYIAAKENIYLHQHEGDIAIFNEDNDITRSLSEKVSARMRLFSRREEVADGAFLRGDTIVLRHDGCEEAVMQISDIRLPGMHNVENYLAAVTALDGLVPYEVMRETARTFVGVEHRIEPVRTIRGVQWYNDSIASSPTRTIAGLNAFNEKVILLAGGYDKHIPFAPLAPEVVKHVKLLILCGATADAIEKAVRECPDYHGSPEIVRCESLEDCVKTAYERAVRGDIVTLSPACAAFDQFTNFMERGKAFKKLVIGIATLVLLCSLPLTGCSSGTSDASSSASGAAVELAQTTVTVTDADGQVASYTVETAAEGATVLSVIQATDADVTVEDGQYGTYISAINGLAAEGSSGWVYTVNGEQVMESVDACPVADGDTVEFSYITM